MCTALICAFHLLLCNYCNRSNKHAVAQSIARRLTIKAKVAHEEARLERLLGVAAPAPNDVEVHASFKFPHTHMPAIRAYEEDLVAFLPHDGVSARDLRSAGGMRRVLQDSYERRVGSRPHVDLTSMRVHPFAAWPLSDGTKYRIHARRAYYGRPRYDWVQVSGDGDSEDEWWYGRLLLLFSCIVDGMPGEFALVRWLEEVQVPRDHVIGAAHYIPWHGRIQVVQLSSVWQRVAFVTSPLYHAHKAVVLRLSYGLGAEYFGEDDDEGE